MNIFATQTNHAETGAYFLFHVFQRSSVSLPKKANIPPSMPMEISTRHRDAAVWRLLCLEDRIDVGDLEMYWELMDQMMEISTDSAIRLLQTLYEYRVRKLTPKERAQAHPGVANDLYRLEYLDERGSFRDVCAGTLINEAVDVLAEEAKRLARAYS